MMYDKCWADLTTTVCDIFVIVLHNKMGYQFLVSIILMAHQLGTYVFDMLDLPSDKWKLNSVLSMDNERKQSADWVIDQQAI